MQWGCYVKWAEKKIATASTSKQAPYQSPFAISMCPLDYRMPEAHMEMVKVSKESPAAAPAKVEIHFAITVQSA